NGVPNWLGDGARKWHSAGSDGSCRRSLQRARRSHPTGGHPAAVRACVDDGDRARRGPARHTPGHREAPRGTGAGQPRRRREGGQGEPVPPDPGPHGRSRVVDELGGGPVGRSPVPPRRSPRWGPAGGAKLSGGWLHSPVKEGLRFSKKALIASWRSLVEKTIDWCRDSCSRTSSNGRENESLMARFMSAIAMGGPAASFAAMAATGPSSSAAGTTRLAMPISYVLAASLVSPRSDRSLARSRP